MLQRIAAVLLVAGMCMSSASSNAAALPDELVGTYEHQVSQTIIIKKSGRKAQKRLFPDSNRIVVEKRAVRAGKELVRLNRNTTLFLQLPRSIPLKRQGSRYLFETPLRATLKARGKRYRLKGTLTGKILPPGRLVYRLKVTGRTRTARVAAVLVGKGKRVAATTVAPGSGTGFGLVITSISLPPLVPQEPSAESAP